QGPIPFNPGAANDPVRERSVEVAPRPGRRTCERTRYLHVECPPLLLGHRGARGAHARRGLRRLQVAAPGGDTMSWRLLLLTAAFGALAVVSFAPNAVTDLTAIAVTDSAATLRWTEVASNDST